MERNVKGRHIFIDEHPDISEEALLLLTERTSDPSKHWTKARNGQPFSSLVEDLKKASQDSQNTD